MRTLLIFLFMLLPMQLFAEAQRPINIYIDADFTRAVESAQSIHKGITTALSEINNTIHGRPLKIIIKDHRGSSVQSKKNLEAYLKDNDALVVFAGLHSPPLLSNLTFINQNGIIILDPWAAAGPITRYPSAENSVFRLSIDDSKAGHTIVKHAVKKRGCNKAYLLLEDTGWGKSNYNTMNKALETHGLKAQGVEWFNWGIKSHHAKLKIKNIINAGADSILLVANTPESIVFCQAIAELPAAERIPIFSHWGFLGGNFTTSIDKNTRKEIDLSFIQTSFSFMQTNKNQFSKDVFQKAQRLFPDLQNYQDLEAPTGFIHAYDLSRLLIAALQNITLEENMANNRKKLRNALEHIDKDVQGLIKIYNRPFQTFSQEKPDAHEALTLEDFSMAQFGDNDEILLIDND